MTRLEEYNDMVKTMNINMDMAIKSLREREILDPRATTNITLSIISTTLIDISKSLAVIADKLSEEEDS